MADEENSPESGRDRKALMKRLRAAQIEQQKREILRRFLTPDAYERISNVRMSNYELYNRLVELVLAMAQSNRAVSKITDEQLRTILSKLTSRPEPRLEIKHK